MTPLVSLMHVVTPNKFGHNIEIELALKEERCSGGGGAPGSLGGAPSGLKRRLLEAVVSGGIAGGRICLGRRAFGHFHGKRE